MTWLWEASDVNWVHKQSKNAIVWTCIHVRSSDLKCANTTMIVQSKWQWTSAAGCSSLARCFEVNVFVTQQIELNCLQREWNAKHQWSIRLTHDAKRNYNAMSFCPSECYFVRSQSKTDMDITWDFHLLEHNVQVIQFQHWWSQFACSFEVLASVNCILDCFASMNHSFFYDHLALVHQHAPIVILTHFFVSVTELNSFQMFWRLQCHSRCCDQPSPSKWLSFVDFQFKFDSFLLERMLQMLNQQLQNHLCNDNWLLQWHAFPCVSHESTNVRACNCMKKALTNLICWNQDCNFVLPLCLHALQWSQKPTKNRSKHGVRHPAIVMWPAMWMHNANKQQRKRRAQIISMLKICFDLFSVLSLLCVHDCHWTHNKSEGTAVTVMDTVAFCNFLHVFPICGWLWFLCCVSRPNHDCCCCEQLSMSPMMAGTASTAVGSCCAAATATLATTSS